MPCRVWLYKKEVRITETFQNNTRIIILDSGDTKTPVALN
jgi:hypothetical protein